MGWVWKAEQVQWGAPVAVKIIDLRSHASPDGPTEQERALRIRRFLAEAKTAATIRSPHVVQILDHGIDQELGAPYIVMELLEGETLEARLERAGRLTPSETIRVMSQVAKALSRVHEAQLVHRDLKPSNIFLVRNDGEDLVKVLDFGIAKGGQGNLDERPITATGQQIGTPYYMSPEQIRGSTDVDFRTDLWAFGVIAYECVVGQRPFNGETLGDLSLKICAEPIPRASDVVSVPRTFDDWFWRCVNRERDFTFGSAREAAERLDGALSAGRNGNELQAHVEPVAPGLGRAERNASVGFGDTTEAVASTPGRNSRVTRSGRILALTALVLLALGGGGAWLLTRSPATPSSADASTSVASAASIGAPKSTPTAAPEVTAPVMPQAPDARLTAPAETTLPANPVIAAPATASRPLKRELRSSSKRPADSGGAASAAAPSVTSRPNTPKTPHDLIEDRR